MDRISQLPDFIVHHILSFLPDSPPAELVRMSVLSKTWFHLTASFPILNNLSLEKVFSSMLSTPPDTCEMKKKKNREDSSTTTQLFIQLSTVYNSYYND
ncbi:putative F-box domain, leucine-rich repeat domain superfamily, F-box-like domain superfamily [Helianthus annuus]|nr:putative F-box domain, leucine-rich repeat domain superfamily, F-box-like domain superfamily [Helianthus annuus]